MLIHGQPANSTVRAVGDTRLYVLRRADFLPVLKQRRPRTRVKLDLPLHAGVRLLSAALLLVALVFFLALLMELGREGDLRMIPTAFPAATRFTGDYLQNLTQGDLGMVASPFGRSEGRPVLEELRQALPKSLGLLAVSLLLAATIGLYLGMGAALRRNRGRQSQALRRSCGPSGTGDDLDSPGDHGRDRGVCPGLGAGGGTVVA